MEYILQYILPSILGDVIQGIDKNNMKTNFLSGKVSLHGVSLNPSILKGSNLPVKIIYSNISQLEITIPWLQRLKQPIVLNLEDLFVILEHTSDLENFDIVEERLRFLEDLTNECRKKLKNLSNKEVPKEGSTIEYYKVLILDNLQVNIKNIHIRVENQEKGFSFGFTLDEIKMCTVNEKGEPNFLDRTLEENKMKDLHKKLFIKDISLYWNSKESKSFYFSSPQYDVEQKKKFLKDSIIRTDNKNQLIQPLLSLSLESCLVLKNVNKEQNEKEPSYKLEIDLKPINVTLNNEQVNQMISTIDSIVKKDIQRRKMANIIQLSEEEKRNDIILYQKILTEFLQVIEDPGYSLYNEIKDEKNKLFLNEIKRLLSRLPNEAIVSVSREVILNDEKRRLIINMEKKKSSKKGFFSYWASDTDDTEELQKVEKFVNGFIEENSEQKSKSLMKGFVFQVHLKLSKIGIFLIDSKANNQQGILTVFNNARLNVQFYSFKEFDLTRIEFLLQDVKLSLKRIGPQENLHKEVVLLTKYDPADVKEFVNASLEIKNYSDGKTSVDLKGNLQGSEFTFMPELLIQIKGFLKFEKPKNQDNIVNAAYEKLADMSKNAQNQIKTMINDNSSTISISLSWPEAYIILPLNPLAGKESDSWILSVKGLKIYTDMEEVMKENDLNYEKFKFELASINVRYAEKILYHEAQKKNVIEKEVDITKKVIPLLEDMRFAMQLEVLQKNLWKSNKADANAILNIYIGEISVNLNQLLYKKLFELKNCLDFSQEKDLNEYLETEKQMIMKTSELLLRVYFKENDGISNVWTEYYIVCSGLYLYFFKSHKDTKVARNVLIKSASMVIENDSSNFPYILRITNRFGEVMIALDTENNLNKLIQFIQKKNEDYLADNLSFSVVKPEVQRKIKPGSEPVENLQKTLFQLNMLFEGLNVNLYEQNGRRSNQLSLSKLCVEFNHKMHDDTLKIQLSSIWISDYTFNLDPQQPTFILDSHLNSLEQSIEKRDLISIKARFLDDKHPDYKTNLNEKEVSVLLNHLSINYMPERIYFLMDFFTSPLSKTSSKQEADKLNKSEDKMNEELPNQIAGEERHYVGQGGQGQKEPKIVVGNVKANELCITLYTRISHLKLGQVRFQKLDVDFNIDKNQLASKGYLKNVQIFDLTNFQQSEDVKEIIPYELLGVEKGLSVLELEFIRRKDSYLEQIGSDIKNILNASVNSVRINYVQQPVSRILTYAKNFILDFGFAEIYTYEEKVNKAVDRLKTPLFTSINATVKQPKVIVQASPNSKVCFELNIQSITVTNEHLKNINRILKPVNTLEFVFTEMYKISLLEVALTKKITGKDSIQLGNSFNMDISYERCLWYEEYILAHKINVHDKFNILENGYQITGSSTPIYLKFTQEDYLDIMDTVKLNLSYDDFKDPLYYIDVENTPEVNITNVPTPIRLHLALEYFAVVAMDQVMNSPLVRLKALSTSINFDRNRARDKDINIVVRKLIANYFEKDAVTNQEVEKTLLGHSYIQRDTAEYSMDANLNCDVLAQEKDDLEKDKDTLVKIEYRMYANRDKDCNLIIDQLKLMLNLQVLLRLKDFFKFDDSGDDHNINTNPNKQSKTQYQGKIRDAELHMNGSGSSAVIFKGSVIFDYVKYDPSDLILLTKDFTDSSILNISLFKSRIFVFDENALHDDRMATERKSIIVPFSANFKRTEKLNYETDNNTLLAQNEYFWTIDKVVLKVTSSDSIVTVDAIKNLSSQFDIYKNLPEFQHETKETKLRKKLREANQHILPSMKVLAETHKVIHNGIQIRVINDFSGVSVPLLDFSLHATNENNMIFLHKSMDLLQGKNSLEVSSSFFNSKVGKWEPIIEKWGFNLELIFEDSKEYEKIVHISNSNQETFNINVSDEMLEIILMTYRDWNERFSLLKVPINKTIQPASEILYNMLAATLDEESNNVEHVSPVTIWNDTGYPLHVEPYIAVNTKKGVSCKKKLDLEPGDQQDFVIDVNVDRLFEASTKEKMLERLKVFAWMKHPLEGVVPINDIDIHNFGTKKRKVGANECFEILCTVYTHKKKKFVRFSSSVIIKNSLPKTVIVQVFSDDEVTWTTVKIAPRASASLPFDMAHNSFSFHLENIDANGVYKIFTVKSLVQNPQAKTIGLANYFASLRTESSVASTTILLEPIVTIKNSLPLPMYMDIQGVREQQVKQIQNVLDTQESLQLIDFSQDFYLKIQCNIGQYLSSPYTILPYDPKATPLIFLINKEKKEAINVHQNDTVPLAVYTNVSPQGIYNISITAKVVVIDESMESLFFLGADEKGRTWTSPFYVQTEGGQFVIFDDVPALKICPRNNPSSVSTAMPFNQPGVFSVDVFDGQKASLNFGVYITHILCDSQNNIFTKVASIVPRYVIRNKTKYVVSFYQSGMPEKDIVLLPDERSPFHFSSPGLEKVLRVKLHSTKDDQPWNDSGELDVSGPGTLDFVCQNFSLTQDKYFNMLVSVEGASLFMTLTEQDPSDTSIQIRNSFENCELIVSQIGTKNFQYSVFPGSTMPFAWLQPCVNTTIVFRLETYDGTSSEICCDNLNEINKPVTQPVKLGPHTITVSYCVTLKGRARMIEFYSGQKQENQENKRSDKGGLLFKAVFPSVGISLTSTLSDKKCELAYISLNPVMFVMVDKDDVNTIQVRVNSIAIDNNAKRGNQHPVMLFAHNLQKLTKKNLPHLDFLCKIKHKQKPSDILYIQHLAFYLAKTSLYLDGHTLNHLSDFVRGISKVLNKAVYEGIESYKYPFLSEKERRGLLKSYYANQRVSQSWRNINPEASKTDFVFIERVSLQPLMLNVTFKNPQFDFGGTYVFAYFKNALGKALATLDNVSINLSGIEIQSIYCTKSQAFGGLVERYKDLAKQSVAKIILSSNIIGNPVKFFSKVSRGVVDLVEKPAQGFLEGPLEGGIGVIGGVGSLAAKTVGAAFSSVHGITDSLASSLSNLTGDKAFIAKREEANSKKNSNALTGSAQAVKSIGKGLLSGVVGVVEKPVSGAIKGGFGGFMKGVLNGAKGLAIKPVTGVLDGVSKLTEGVSNTIDKDEGLRITKSRIPRAFYGRERIIKTYEEFDADLFEFLCKKSKKYMNYTLLEVILVGKNQNEVSKATHCLVLTLERLFFISLEYRAILWKIKSQNIGESFISEEGVEIILKNPTKKLQQQMALIPCSSRVKKEEISTLLKILQEIVEETL